MNTEKVSYVMKFRTFSIEGFKRKWTDVAYANQSESQKLDIFIPDEGEGPFPTVIMIHGGGWMHGDKRADVVAGILRAYNAGYAIVSINHRSTLDIKWPAQMYDVKAAIRYLRANAAKYYLDPDKFAIMGESSGAHLAAVAATSAGDTELEDLSMGNAAASCAVQAAVIWYGPVAPHLVQEQRYIVKTSVPPADDDGVDMLFGADPFTILEKARKACAVTYINEETPPFLLQHGKDDTMVPYIQAVDFAEELKRVIGEENVELDLFEGTKHAEEAVFNSDENIYRVIRFLDKVLMGATQDRDLELPIVPITESWQQGREY